VLSVILLAALFADRDREEEVDGPGELVRGPGPSSSRRADGVLVRRNVVVMLMSTS
jgi:hypothetical protein